MPYAIRNGVNIDYETYGKGPAIVFLHPFSTNGYVWCFQFFSFALSHQCIVVDERGHGRSDKPDQGYAIEDMAADLKAVFEDLQIDKSITVGNSIGGMVAMQFNLDYPELVAGNLLLSSTTGLAEGLPAEAREAFQAYLNGAPFSALIQGMVSNKTKTERPEIVDMMNALFDSEDNFPKRIFTAATTDPGGVFNWNITERLNEIHKPTLVLAGEEDLTAGVAASKILADNIPNAQFKIIRDVGHFCQLERPEVFNHELREFIKHVGF